MEILELEKHSSGHRKQKKENKTNKKRQKDGRIEDALTMAIT